MTAQLTIFPTEAQGRRHAALIDALAPIAAGLAHRAGPEGITAENVRRAGETAGLLTGDERGRALSFLPHVFRAAGLVKTDRFRRSGIPRAHGNLGRVWVAPQWSSE